MGVVGEGVMTYEKVFLVLHTLCHISSINDAVPKIICWTTAVFHHGASEMIFHNYTTMFHRRNHPLSTLGGSGSCEFTAYFFCWVVCHCHILLRCVRQNFLVSALSAINNFSDPRFFLILVCSHYSWRLWRVIILGTMKSFWWCIIIKIIATAINLPPATFS